MPPQSLILRYESSGALDATFGTGGIATVPGNMALDSLVLTSNGMYVAAGHQGQQIALPKDIAVARMMSNGQLDPTFGSGMGFVVVLAGTTALVGLLANGDVDPNYGNAGLGVIPSLPGNSAAYAIGQQPSGKLVVGGYGFWRTRGTDFAIVRLAP
jgi:uncharacterized delta-60 repeat protein